MGAFDGWIGRSEAVTDRLDQDRISGLWALLDRDGPPPVVLPPLGHWLLGRPIVRQSAIDSDGHPKRGGDALLPPIALPRRMWAGSTVDFLAPVPVGAAIERRSTIAAIEEKTGRSGSMVFVGIDHEILVDGSVAIRERQDVVYREANIKGAAAAPVIPDDARVAEATRVFTADSVALFRYSALTLNSHRIHYDRDFAQAVEGYPGLVVHGPLAATVLLDHYCQLHPDRPVAHFSFRARAPLFDGEPMTLCAAKGDLWINDIRGTIAVMAAARSSHARVEIV
jgi:3-methylfumaryl-CoA hydratase